MKDQEIAYLQVISKELQKEGFAAEVIGYTLTAKKGDSCVALFYHDEKLWMFVQVSEKRTVFRWMRGEFTMVKDKNGDFVAEKVAKDDLGKEEFSMRELINCLNGLLKVAKEVAKEKKEKALPEVEAVAS